MAKRINLLLLLILLIAAVTRFWGINFGLPHLLSRPDEKYIVDIVTSPLNAFHPGTLYYGTFYKYCVLVVYGFYFLLGSIFGKFSSLGDFIAEYAVNPSSFYLINRCFVALLGTATVYIVFLVAKTLYKKEVAFIAAFFLGMSFLHVRDSHFGTMDVPQTFLIMCSFLFMLRSYYNSKLRNYLLAGIFAGLAMSTKYTSALLVIPMVVIHMMNVKLMGTKNPIKFFDKRFFLFVSSLLFLFFLSSPYIIIDFTKFIDNVSYLAWRMGTRHYIDIGRGWMYHLKFSLFYGLGWSFFIISIAGIFLVFKINRRKATILLSFPLVYYLAIGSSYTAYARYVIPLIPFLCITASVVPVYIRDVFFHKLGLNARKIILLFMILFIIFPSAINVIKLDRLLEKKDNRVIASEWVQENIPQGSSVYQPDSKFGKLQLFPTVQTLEKEHKRILEDGGHGRASLARIEFQRKNNITGYQEWEYDEETDNFLFEGKVKRTIPDYIITESSPLKMRNVIPESIKRLLESSYSLEKVFKAIDIEEEKNLFDPLDAFYVPFAGFRNVERPGPNIYIYKKL